MSNPTPITLSDYIAELSRASGTDFGPVGDDLVPGGCERCHTPITSHTGCFARFGMLRCADCIGDDGFATIADLELFRQTGTLPCPGCGHPVQPSHISLDGVFYTYQCPACGKTVRFTFTARALAIWGPGIAGNRP